ncbi:MAG TPA: hypothetical protein VM575_10945 [Nocardioides sp.]|jgi:hypothetical protein|nr:hypothetical protein [Nocardioides sp.]
MGIARRAISIVALLVLAAGCGDDDADERDELSDQPTRLVVTRADGTEVVFDEVTAKCGPSENDSGEVVVRIEGITDGVHLSSEIVAADVEGDRTFALPIDFGDQEQGVRNLYLFVGAEPDLETSTTQEESTGTLEVVRAACDPVEVELTIDATLGSEYFDGEPVDVEGRLVFPAPAG